MGRSAHHERRDVVTNRGARPPRVIDRAGRTGRAPGPVDGGAGGLRRADRALREAKSQGPAEKGSKVLPPREALLRTALRLRGPVSGRPDRQDSRTAATEMVTFGRFCTSINGMREEKGGRMASSFLSDVESIGSGGPS